MECNGYDVLFKHILLSSIETSCWTVQNVESDEMFWFSQMISFNVYIPLLLRQANDGEENPGPTIDLMSLIQQDVLTTVKEMKLSLVKMLVSNV